MIGKFFENIAPNAVVCVRSDNSFTVFSAPQTVHSNTFPGIHHVTLHVALVKVAPDSAHLRKQT